MRYKNSTTARHNGRAEQAGTVRWPSAHRENVYQFILAYAAEHGGASPTTREIMDATGITSTSVVNYQVKCLIALGKLEVRDHKLIVVGASWTPPQGEG